MQSSPVQRLLIILIAFVALVAAAPAQQMGSVLLKNVTLVGNDGKLQERVDISVVAGAIQAIGPNLMPMLNQQVVDKSGKFVIPGLVDTRVQIAASPGNRISRAEMGEEQRIAWMHSLLGAGVTTARFIQGDLTEHTGFKHFRILNLLNGPWIVASGPTFTAPDGIPANQYSVAGTATRLRETSEAADVDEALRMSREVAHNGADIFEINYSAGPPWVAAPRLDDKLLALITKEAHGHDLRAFCWVGTNAEAKSAVDNGCDVLQGLSEEVVNDEVLKLMADKKIPFVPSLVNQGYLVTEKTDPQALKLYLAEEIVHRALSPLMLVSFQAPDDTMIKRVRASLAWFTPPPPKPEEESGNAENKSDTAAQTKPRNPADHQAQTIPETKPQDDATNTRRPTNGEALRAEQSRVRQSVKRMAAAGIPIVVGTGAGSLLNIPGASEHLEMELLVDAGLTPLQALQAATSNAALALGKPRDFGTVEKGKLADMVLLDANPLANILNTMMVDSVVRGGWLVERDQLDQY